MLRVSIYTAAHAGRSLQQRRTVTRVVKSVLWSRRPNLLQQQQQYFGVPPPHARFLNCPPAPAVHTALARGLATWPDRRRARLRLTLTPLPLKTLQYRGLASGGGGGGGNGGGGGKSAKHESKSSSDGQEEDAVFGRFRKTIQEELDKVQDNSR